MSGLLFIASTYESKAIFVYSSTKIIYITFFEVFDRLLNSSLS